MGIGVIEDAAPVKSGKATQNYMVQYSNNTDDKESSTGLGINVITNFV
jgi:hypothetical protein